MDITVNDNLCIVSIVRFSYQTLHILPKVFRNKLIVEEARSFYWTCRWSDYVSSVLSSGEGHSIVKLGVWVLKSALSIPSKTVFPQQLIRHLSVFGPFTNSSFNAVDPFGNKELLTNLTRVIAETFRTS